MLSWPPTSPSECKILLFGYPHRSLAWPSTNPKALQSQAREECPNRPGTSRAGRRNTRSRARASVEMTRAHAWPRKGGGRNFVNFCQNPCPVYPLRLNAETRTTISPLRALLHSKLQQRRVGKRCHLLRPAVVVGGKPSSSSSPSCPLPSLLL